MFKKCKTLLTLYAIFLFCVLSLEYYLSTFQVPWFPKWFNFIYDGDQAVYTYHKLDNDLEAADLEIIV